MLWFFLNVSNFTKFAFVTFPFPLLGSFYVQFGNVLKAKVFFLLPLIVVVVSFALFAVVAAVT